VESGVVSDQKDVTDVLGKAAKTAHEFNLACLVKLVLDHTPRSDRELGEDQLHGFARPPGARAQDKVEIPYRCRKSLADPACGLATTAVQGSLVIFDLLLPARLGVTQQMQHMHGLSPERASHHPFWPKHDLPASSR